MVTTGLLVRVEVDISDSNHGRVLIVVGGLPLRGSNGNVVGGFGVSGSTGDACQECR